MLARSAICSSVGVGSLIAWKRSTIFASQLENDYELCFVQVVFRHGSRTPVKVPHFIPVTTYEPTLLRHCQKTYIDYKLHPLHEGGTVPGLVPEMYGHGVLEGGCPYGQLTALGAEQLYDLGKCLRRKYIEELDFLPSSPDDLADAVYTRTTNMQRTIMSARSLLAGLFPEKPSKDVKIYLAPDEEEVMAMNFNFCKAMQKLLHTWMNPSCFGKMSDQIRRIFALSPEERVDMIILRDNLEVEKSLGKPNLETALGIDLAQNIQTDVTAFMKTLAGDGDASTLSLVIGPFVDILVQNMENIRNGKTQNKKIHLYSGHDVTIIPLLSALNIENSEWPPYASNIIIEFYRRTLSGNDHYFIKVLYNGVEVSVGDCKSKFCPLEEFVQYVDGIRVSYDAYMELCNKTD